VLFDERLEHKLELASGGLDLFAAPSLRLAEYVMSCAAAVAAAGIALALNGLPMLAASRRTRSACISFRYLKSTGVGLVHALPLPCPLLMDQSADSE